MPLGRRSRCPWRLCEHVGSIVVRATFSPTVTLPAAAAARRELAGRLPCAVLLRRNKVLFSTYNMATMVAAGRCWCLLVMNSSITVHLAQASSLDVLVLVGEVGLQAGLHTIHILLHEEMRRACGLRSCPA